MSASDFDVRPTEARDAAALDELYRRLTARERTHAQWRWEWLGGPHGPAPSWVIVERASGRLVGHHGLIPLELRASARVVRAARTDNTMVDPDYRTTLYYPAYEAQLFKQYRERYDVLFTAVAGDVQAAMRRRLGYQPIARWVDFVVADPLGYRAARSLGRAAGSIARALTSAPRMRDGDAWLLTTDAERVARLCERANSGDLAPRRSAAYLRWRLVEHPWHAYQLALLVRGGQDVGYVAWREREVGSGAKRVLVHDAFARAEDAAGYRELLEAFAHLHRDSSARIQVRTLDVDTPLANAARELEPERLREREQAGDSLLIACAVARDLPARWDVTTLIDAGI